MKTTNEKNIACLVEYNGSNFYGFQKQNSSLRTIQEELEKAISKFTNEDIAITSAGRTDTGVHATGQVINFRTTANRSLHSYVKGLNALLPKDITIINSHEVSHSFNSRYSATSRTYNYYLLNQPTRSSILYKKVGWYHEKLDLTIMQIACSLLLGENDFSSFRAIKCQAQSPIKTMTQSEVNISLLHRNIFCFKFTANSFLYHMVRNIIGTLIYVGNGKLTITEFTDLITARNRQFAPPTFMPDGLYLTQVTYPDNMFDKNN